MLSSLAWSLASSRSSGDRLKKAALCWSNHRLAYIPMHNQNTILNLVMQANADRAKDVFVISEVIVEDCVEDDSYN